MEKKLVTVCITTFNRKEFLLDALNSILDQTYENLDVIIVDDCSTDGTRELIETKILGIDARIRYLRHETNKGLAAARNTAIASAYGEYFTFCDDDDQWLPEFVEEFVKIANQYDHRWCFCCGGIFNNILGTKIKEISEYEGELKSYFKSGYTPPVASQFYNISSLKDAGCYNEQVKSGVDHDLWLSLIKNGIKMKCIPKALAMPNRNINLDRLTTSYNRRLSGIKKSLLLWKNDLQNIYGKNFYSNFYDAYLLREEKKFLNNHLQNFDFVMALKISKNIKFPILIKTFFLTYIKKILKLIIPKRLIAKERIVKIKPTLNINT